MIISAHQQELIAGFGDVYMPAALARKYKNASKEMQWQYVFPAKKRSIDPRSGAERKHHVMESGLQKAVKIAAKVVLLIFGKVRIFVKSHK